MLPVISSDWKPVLGGFCIHLVLGTLYLWANITNVVTSHLRKYDSSITYDRTLIVYISAVAAQGSLMLVGGLIQSKIGCKRTVLIGGWIIVIGTFLSSFATSLASLIFFDGILFGVGVAFCYSAPIKCSTEWVSNKMFLILNKLI